jgi:hypothetical protein
MTDLTPRSVHPCYASARTMHALYQAMAELHASGDPDVSDPLTALGAEVTAADLDKLLPLAIAKAARLLALVKAAISTEIVVPPPIDQEAWEKQVVTSIVEKLGGSP